MYECLSRFSSLTLYCPKGLKSLVSNNGIPIGELYK